MIFDEIVDSVDSGRDPLEVFDSAVVGFDVGEAIDELWERIKVSKDPYSRAIERIENLERRGVDVVKHTLLRLNKTSKPSKIEGLYQAALDLKMSEIAKAAKKKYEDLTGEQPFKKPR